MSIINNNRIINKYSNLGSGVKATFWFFVCNVLQKTISLITVPIFTRMLTTDEYGIYSSYVTWVNIFSIFTTFKLNFGVFNKGMTKYKEQKNVYVATMQTMTSAFTAIFLLIYILFNKYINSLTELPTLIMLLMIVQLFFDPAFSFWSLKERYELKYKQVVLLTIGMSLLNPIVGFVLIKFSHYHAYARIISCIIVNVGFGLYIYIRNFVNSKPKFSLDIAKYAFFFNLPLIPHYLAEYILDQSDRVMIQKMCSKTDLGLYSVTYNFALAIKLIVTSLNSALIPWLYQNLDIGNRGKVNKVIKLSCILIGTPICLFIIIVPEVMGILLPASYSSAVYVVPPVAMSVYFVFLFGIYGNIEFFYDKNKFTMYVSMIAAALNIVLNYFGILQFGYIAAAYTTLICYFLLNILHAVFMENIKSKGDSLLLDEKFIWTTSIIYAFGSIMFSFLYPYPIVRWCIVIAITFVFVLKKDTVKSWISVLRSKSQEK